MSRLLVGSLAAGAAIAVLAGCGGSAVLVTQTPSGGVLSLDGDRQQAMADARRQMSEHCGGAYHIVGERNATTGMLRDRMISELLVEYACGASP